MHAKIQQLARLIPDEILGELQELGHSISIMEWRVGDLTHDLIQWVQSQADRPDGYTVRCGQYTQNDVYLLVSEFVPCSARMIRYYFETARAFDYLSREKYAPLPFSHFNLARSLPKSEKVLEFSLRLMAENNGRPVSVDYLEWYYQQKSTQDYGEEMPLFDETPVGDEIVMADRQRSYMFYKVREGISSLRALCDRLRLARVIELLDQIEALLTSEVVLL